MRPCDPTHLIFAASVAVSAAFEGHPLWGMISRSQLELAVVEYLGWFNAARLHESLGDIPPLEYEQQQSERREPTTLVGATV